MAGSKQENPDAHIIFTHPPIPVVHHQLNRQSPDLAGEMDLNLPSFCLTMTWFYPGSHYVAWNATVAEKSKPSSTQSDSLSFATVRHALSPDANHVARLGGNCNIVGQMMQKSGHGDLGFLALARSLVER